MLCFVQTVQLAAPSGVVFSVLTILRSELWFSFSFLFLFDKSLILLVSKLSSKQFTEGKRSVIHCVKGVKLKQAGGHPSRWHSLTSTKPHQCGEDRYLSTAWPSASVPKGFLTPVSLLT